MTKAMPMSMRSPSLSAPSLTHDSQQCTSGADSITRHVQRLQLGGRGRTRRRQEMPSRSSERGPAAFRRLLAQSFRSADSATYLLHGAARQGVPVFQVAFAHGGSGSRLLAAVDEDGTVSVIDTASQAPTVASTSIYRPAHRQWRAHENAIFDVVWTRDDRTLLTAAGDLRVCAWDIETGCATMQLKGHTMSVKCVRPSPVSDHVLASGGRDGNVLLWDARAPNKPVAQLLNVHGAPPRPTQSAFATSTAAFVSPVGTRKRRKTGGASASSPRSVTCVEFAADGHEIITAGAVDGLVKFWDVRRVTSAPPSRIVWTPSSSPVRVVSCSSREGAHRGITSLALDHSRTRLLVNVLNDELRIVDARSGSQASTPLLRCEGHVANSFYVKSAFSPDGGFVMSGSGDGAVFMWDATTSLSNASATVRLPMLALKGHSSDVNGVAWHGSDFTQLATCSDDGTVRVWQTDRSIAGLGGDSATAAPFELKRTQRAWSNWSEFENQEPGRAYAVDSSLCREDSVPDTKVPASTSPPVIRRGAPVLARERTTPSPQPNARRRAAPVTLLDLWQR